ncbi:MAG: phage head closure protein [Leuconostoc pseudomesenteroides]
MLKYKPSDFNKKAQFGSVQEVPNPHTDSPQRKFVADATLRYAPRTRTMTQQYSLLGTTLEDTIIIVTRHNKVTSNSLVAKLADGKYYDVIGSSPDESNNIITYDIVTLKYNKSIKG